MAPSIRRRRELTWAQCPRCWIRRCAAAAGLPGSGNLDRVRRSNVGSRSVRPRPRFSLHLGPSAPLGLQLRLWEGYYQFWTSLCRWVAGGPSDSAAPNIQRPHYAGRTDQRRASLRLIHDGPFHAPPRSHARLAIACLGISALALSTARAADVPALVPWPHQVELSEGRLSRVAKAGSWSPTSKLAPLAAVLADEIAALTGVRLPTATGSDNGANKPTPGDLVLVLDPALAGEAYQLEIRDRATVSGGNYGAAVLGTATLLQALEVQDGRPSLARMTVHDRPATEFRGLMIDVARQSHSLDTLKYLVTLARYYKLNYVQAG